MLLHKATTHVNIVVANIHGGEVAVVMLTEIKDSTEDGEKLAVRIRWVRRARARREQRKEAGSIEKNETMMDLITSRLSCVAAGATTGFHWMET